MPVRSRLAQCLVLLGATSNSHADEVQLQSRLTRTVPGCSDGGAIQLAGTDWDGDGTLSGDEILVEQTLCACNAGEDPRSFGLWTRRPWDCGSTLRLALPSDEELPRGFADSAIAALMLLSQTRPGTIGDMPLEPQLVDGEVCTLARIDRARTPSSYCLGCHDGTIAPSVTRFSEIRHDRSHPVGTDYAAIQATGFGALRPPAELDPALVLVDGKLECTTCHDGDAPSPSHTALPMNRSAMCLGCHDR